VYVMPSIENSGSTLFQKKKKQAKPAIGGICIPGHRGTGFAGPPVPPPGG